MEFKIHGHSCLEVISEGKSLICDPWLVGSAYWRSWWNYPPVPTNLIDSIDTDYIYITHLHWDHFHGPSLRRLGTDKTLIIPKTPEMRLLKDIQSIGFKNIIELKHGKSLKLADNFKITSYQFNPIFADSAVIIEAEDKVFLNANDTKLMGLPLKQILKRHPKIDFVLRSHSSANSRLCYEIVDKGGTHIDDLDRYSKEFTNFARAVGAEYAIPFASNQCCLHPETIQYNQYSNYAHKVAKYFQEQEITHPQCVVMAPGDRWKSDSGFELQDNSYWYEDAPAKIEEYRQAKSTTLDKTVAREKQAKFKESLAKRYAEWIIAETPWFMRRYFKDRTFTLIGYSDRGSKALHLDLYNQTYEIIEEWNLETNPIQIYVNNAVLNDVWAKRHWNSLGVSKRLKIKTTQANVKYYEIFNLLNNALEAGSLQSRYIFTPRYVTAYARRWREILLYFTIIFNKLRGNSFKYEDYLTLN